jgi:hypothetical protein
MMGVPIDGPATVLVDNVSVVKNSTTPSSMLQKKHNSICYHFVREAVAARIIRIAFILSSENLASHSITTCMNGVTAYIGTLVDISLDCDMS